jgi:hypothetical protein
MNPSGAEKAAGCFVEIVASPALRDNLKHIDIQVDYERARLPAGTDESSLKLYLWDVASGTWQLVPGSSVNTTGQYIYGTITHLSKYGDSAPLRSLFQLHLRHQAGAAGVAAVEVPLVKR